MARDLQGGNSAPSDPPRRSWWQRKPLICVRPTRLWVIVPNLLTVWIHWDGRRSFRCGFDGADGPCVGCEEGWPRRAQHWIQVQDDRQHRPVMLFQLTPLGLASCPRLEACDGVLPGERMETWRDPQKPTGRQYVRLLRGEPLLSLPPTQTTLSILTTMWEAADRKAPVRRPKLFRPGPDDDAPGVGDPADDPPDWYEK